MSAPHPLAAVPLQSIDPRDQQSASEWLANIHRIQADHCAKLLRMNEECRAMLMEMGRCDVGFCYADYVAAILDTTTDAIVSLTEEAARRHGRVT